MTDKKSKEKTIDRLELVEPLNLGAVTQVKSDSQIEFSEVGSKIPGKVLTEVESQTSFKTIPMHLAAQAAKHLAGMLAAIGEMPIIQLESNAAVNVTHDCEPKEPDLRPVPIRPGLIKIGPFDGSFAVNWHQVSNLPNYIQDGIRRLGEHCFHPFSGQFPTGEMLTVSTLANEEFEMATVLNWIKHNGRKVDEAKLVFGAEGQAKLIGNRDQPENNFGYQAKLQVWQVGDSRVKIVQDFVGIYAYVWPHKDESTLASKPQVRQLSKSHPA